MNRKKQKDLLSEYARIPNQRAEDHLSSWQEKQVCMEKTPKEKRDVRYAFLRSPYFIGALVCVILISIILPIVLIYSQQNKSENDQPSTFYCDSSELIFTPIESEDELQEICKKPLLRISNEALMTGYSIVTLQENGDYIGVSIETFFGNDYIWSATVIALTEDYRLEDVNFLVLKDSVIINGIKVDYSIPQNIVEDCRMNFSMDGVEYYVTLKNNDRSFSIETLFEHLF